MAKSSMQVMQSIQKKGKMPNYKQEIAKTYDAPVLRPLVQEASNLESQYLPALFDPFTKMGTGAADMSPAAKLSALGSSLGRLQGRIGANQSIQNFYGMQMNDLANTMSQNWRDQLANKWQMYNAMAQREEAAAARAAAAQQTIDWNKYFGDRDKPGKGDVAGDNIIDIDAMNRQLGSSLSGLFNKNQGLLSRMAPGIGLAGGFATGMIPGLNKLATVPLLSTGISALMRR